MMQKETLTVECLFLHDSLMSAMEADQRMFRSLLRTDSPVPFGFLPPFFPCPDLPSTALPVFGALEARDGWIVRPLLHCPEYRMPGGESSIEWPDFLPAIPGIPGFILGYAGDEAEGLLSRAGETAAQAEPPAAPVRPAARAERSTDLPIRVWYHAALTAVIMHEGSSFISARYEIGPARWVRRLG